MVTSVPKNDVTTKMDPATEKIVTYAVAGAIGLAILGGAALPLARELARRRRDDGAPRPPWDAF